MFLDVLSNMRNENDDNIKSRKTFVAELSLSNIDILLKTFNTFSTQRFLHNIDLNSWTQPYVAIELLCVLLS